jgi:hypothetical protein
MFLLTTFLHLSLASAAETKNQLDLIKLTDRIYIIEDHFYVRENSVVYIGDRGVTVVSATWTPATATENHSEGLSRLPLHLLCGSPYYLPRQIRTGRWKHPGPLFWPVSHRGWHGGLLSQRGSAFRRLHFKREIGMAWRRELNGVSQNTSAHKVVKDQNHHCWSLAICAWS